MDIVYLDFSKAFHKAPHNILVRKLVKCGLNEVTDRHGHSQDLFVGDSLIRGGRTELSAMQLVS